MTQEEWIACHGRYERFARPQFRKGLRLSYEPLLNNLNVLDYGNYQTLSQALVSPEPLRQAYLTVYTKVGLTHGKLVGRQLNNDRKEFVSDIYESDFLKAIYDWIQTNLGLRITQVNQYTIELIQKLVETAKDRNYSVSQLRKYLEQKLNSPDFNRMRSLRIARTETTTAANHAAFVVADQSDLLMDKQWISVMDERTRHDHLVENDQTVGQYESFQMADGSELLFPGDHTAPAKQIVNCRCTFNLIPKRDAEGMLLFKA